MIPQKNQFSYARGFLKQGVVAKDYGKLLIKSIESLFPGIMQ